MTIRFTCDKCGSVLKIKDELAGTDGKCPKCKTRFVVPQPSAEEPVVEQPAEQAPVSLEITPPAPEPEAPVKVSAKASEKPASGKPAPKPAKKPVDDDDFDPVSFLMEGPKKKPTFEPDPAPASRGPLAGGRPNSSGGGGFSLDDDDSTSDQEAAKPAPTRKWGAKKDPSQSTGERSFGSTNAAKDLLSRSMEESRVRASEMPEEAPRFSFDFAGFFREVGLKTGGMIVGGLFAVLGLYLVMNNMMTPEVKLPPLGYVSGTVTLDGKPVSGVMVHFTPLDTTILGAKNNETARDSSGLTDAEGHFDLRYLPEVEGVKEGRCRVWMEALDPSVIIPANYGQRSDHIIEVKHGTNEPVQLDI